MNRTDARDTGNLLTDLVTFGPAPTPGRELAVLAVNALLVGVVAFVLLDASPAALVLVALAAAYHLGRAAVGVRRWRADAVEESAR